MLTVCEVFFAFSYHELKITDLGKVEKERVELLPTRRFLLLYPFTRSPPLAKSDEALCRLSKCAAATEQAEANHG